MMTRAVSGSGREVSLLAVLIRLGPPAIIALAFAAAGIVHVCSRVLVVDMGYRLSTLERKSRELTREHDRLKLELATLKSPNRLERIAREQLGMGPAPAISVLALGPSAPRLGRAASGAVARSNATVQGRTGEGRAGEVESRAANASAGKAGSNDQVRPFRLADRGVAP